VNIWLIMLAGGAITFLTRLSFIAILGQREIPAWLQRSLRLVPPAVLTAILVPELIFHSGSLDLSLGNFRLIAGLLAALVAWRTRNTLLTILVGMAVLFLLQAIF
jgi:branched-subunit amino acid transport protein